MSDTTVTHPLVKGEVGPGCAKVDPIVVADNVTRQFGGLKAVDVDHLEIPRGQITALIGPNGAGKTTLFNLLTGFDKPNTGSWSFEGSNLAECHPVAFQWVMEAKARGATVIHVDPRYTRTSALADVHVPLRAGTDIAFLGGIINYVLEHEAYFREYVETFTNASMLGAMLSREVEDPIFDATRRWLEKDEDAYFFLVFDELHLVRGSAGTEVSFLVKSLLQRLVQLHQPFLFHNIRVIGHHRSGVRPRREMQHIHKGKRKMVVDDVVVIFNLLKTL